MTLDLRKAREKLGLTQAQVAKLLETDLTAVQRWERDPALPSYRQAGARVEQLFQAYLEGFRPPAWPKKADAEEDLI